MAIEIYEFYESRRIHRSRNGDDATLIFVLNGTFDEDEAESEFLSAIPANFLGMLLDDYDVEPVGGMMWRCTAEYSSLVTATQSGGLGSTSDPSTPPEPPGGEDALGPEYSFDISVTSEKITQSKETIVAVKRGAEVDPELGDPPDNQRAIGVTVDGEVEGCDKSMPHFEWSLTRTFGYITLNYLGILYSLVGKTNAATFYGFEAGELLFIGASAQTQGQDKVVISYKFAAKPNETDIVICDDLEVPTKGGWEYLWVSYKNVQTGNKLFMQPDSAYVERIYDSGNFALIGVGA